MNYTLTPGQAKTLAARMARTEAKRRRLAQELREAGWTVVPPVDGGTEKIKGQ